MKNTLLKLLGYLLLVIGIISMFTPIPGGILLISTALTLLICTDQYTQHCLKWMRTRFNWFNKTIYWMENKVGVKIEIMGEALKLTRPSDDDADKSLSHSEYSKKYLDSGKE